MKLSTTLASLLLVLAPILSHAQSPKAVLPSVDLGIKAGADFTKLSGDNWQQSMAPGFEVGAFLGVRVKKIGVQIEALVNTAKYSPNGLASGSDFNTTNLSVPILFQYKLVPMLWLQLGPQYSTVVSASGNNTFGDPKSIFKSGFDGVLGLELKLPVKFNIGARYILGLSDVNNSGSGQAWQKRSAQLYLGFRFI